jgi:transcriptional regulator with XRE-family HTH domain
LADVLAKVRTDAGLTQEQLATALDMTARTVARLETGQMRPSTLTLERIAEATGTILRIRFDPPATPS